MSTYDTTTFSTLGATPGTYEWTWGNGPNQNFTLDVVVPAPLIGCGLPVFLAVGGLLFGAKLLEPAKDSKWRRADKRRARAAAPRHNRRRTLPTVALRPDVEGHSRQDRTGAGARAVAAAQALRAAACDDGQKAAGGASAGRHRARCER